MTINFQLHWRGGWRVEASQTDADVGRMASNCPTEWKVQQSHFHLLYQDISNCCNEAL